MKYSRLIIILSVIIFSCTKKDIPFIPSNSYTGFLDSVSTFSGDSAIATGLYQTFRFSYDAGKRVDRMYVSSTIEDRWYTFFYNATDNNPYFIIDSMLSKLGSRSAWVSKHHLSYDGQGNKIKDSSYQYLIDTASKIILRRDDLGVLTFIYSPTTLLVKKNNNFYDSIYFNSNADVIKATNGGVTVNFAGHYLNNDNPLSKLNISQAATRIISFFGTSVYPLAEIDILQYKHFFTKAVGTNDTFYYCASGETTEVSCSYATNAGNQIETLVIPHYSYRNNQFCSKFYSNIKFYYHP
ncbi:MAG: hypothetical protein ABJA37_15890 [Ferruginibacter sp.]